MLTTRHLSISTIMLLCTLLVGLTIHAGDLQLHLRIDDEPRAFRPYHVYICNMSTNTVTVSHGPLALPVVSMITSSNIVVSWKFDENRWPPRINVGTNTLVIVDDAKARKVVLDSFEARELNQFSLGIRNEWWRSLPENGTVIFEYSVPQSFGDHFGVWSGTLRSQSYPVVGSKIKDNSSSAEKANSPKPEKVTP
jgi:hypothetical protein